MLVSTRVRGRCRATTAPSGAGRTPRAPVVGRREAGGLLHAQAGDPRRVSMRACRLSTGSRTLLRGACEGAAKGREANASHSPRPKHATGCLVPGVSVGPWYVPQQRQPRGVPGNTREAVGVARMVLSGLLPACKAAGELGEWEQKKLEAAVARAVH